MYQFQKILLTLELIVVAAVTLYTGTYAAKNHEEKVAVVESVAESQTEMETAKESESEKVSEIKKAKQEKDKKQETEPETKTQQVVENKVKSENKSTVSSGKSGNTSTTGPAKNNSSAASGGTASKPVTTTKPSGNNPSNMSGTNNNASVASGGTSSKPSVSTPSTSAPSTPQTQAPEPVRPQIPETTHTHNWVESTHEEPREEGHWGEKVIKDAWDEAMYDTVWKDICNGCGLDITNCIDEHLFSQMLAGNMACSGYTTMPVREFTGYTRHEAETEPIWIVDRTWTETVGDGYYICNECGARK